MERLRHVARSGDIDPAVVVAETADALTRLGPAPSELVAAVPQPRRAQPDVWPAVVAVRPPPRQPGFARLRLAARRGGRARSDAGTARRALARRGHGDDGRLSGDHGLGVASMRQRVGARRRSPVTRGPARPRDGPSRRRCRADCSGVDARSPASVPTSCWSRPTAARPRRSSLRWGVALPPSPRRRRRTGLARRRAWDGDCRLPFVEAIACGLDAQLERFATTYVSKVAGPEGVLAMSPRRPRRRVPGRPRAAPELTDGCSHDGTVMKHPSVVSWGQRWAAAIERRRREVAR